MSHSVSKEQADQQLSESLLDPPPSLDLFARRFQSPSRCGSPSMEAPEYLMFGRGTRKQEGEEDVLWREKSPPSRVGRHGLVRRRDSSITDVGAADCVLEWRSSHVLPGTLWVPTWDFGRK
uniref:Uncharacterized protein n=1 Tax=Timema tahoe TaxID=61484 RepID=A0A7R9IJP4_9NEOP|nr:unnamed protein product [Timema tahoe]